MRCECDADERLDGSLSDRTLQQKKYLPYFRLRDIYYFSLSTVHVERRTSLFGIKGRTDQEATVKGRFEMSGIGCWMFD